MWTLLLCTLLAAGADETPAATNSVSPSAEQARFFETRVRPLLVERCGECHGAKKQWAGLRVDSRAALLKGGDSGPAIVPGQPDESLLIRAVRHASDELKMPQNGKLPAEQIADLAKWVEIGAPFTDSATTAKPLRDPNHWAYRAPVLAERPTPRNRNWSRTAIDDFVAARFEAVGLTAAAEADRATLLRRLKFDLTGLPPTPADLVEFAADSNPDAESRLLDRLLAHPAYGQRWGRRWLDVARYADSNGLDENIAHGNAWRYRDYVVRSINADKPFDRFALEQLAGDLLPAADETERHELLTATGLLSIGPKVLAEVNEAKMRMDIVDEQVESVGRVFMAMTLGCARCHDHKFDPVGTDDYYALAGIFKSTRTMETYTKVARWHEHLLPSAAATAMKVEYETRLAVKKKAVEQFVAEADAKARAGLPADSKPPEKLETIYPEATKAELKKLRDAVTEVEKNPPEYPAAMGVGEDKIVDLPIHLRGDPKKLGAVVGRRTPVVIRGPDSPQFSDKVSGREQLARWLVDPRHPLTARVLVNRVWRWHFGRGIVASTDNFGLLGERPSHPELLDWLALEFVADGWSLKRLHRNLLLSAAYRQDSVATPAAIAADPENRWLARARVRRLEAEELRDSLLFVGEQLDNTFGGSLLKVKNRGYLFDHTSIDLTDYTSRRRSLYLPVIRNNVYDLFQLLDFPDPAIPTGDRATTTVAPQALLMLNSDFVMQTADHLAERLWRDSGATDDRARASALVSIALGRTATEAEATEHVAFVQRVERELAATIADAERRRKQAWSLLCHVLIDSNEFCYLR